MRVLVKRRGFQWYKFERNSVIHRHVWYYIILTGNIFVDPILDNLSYLFFIVFLVQLQFVPEVDVTVSRHERGGKKANDEQIPHEPEIGSHIVLVPVITHDIFSQRYKRFSIQTPFG